MNRAITRGAALPCILLLSHGALGQAPAAESTVTFEVPTQQMQALDIETERLVRAGEAITRRFPAKVVVPANGEHVISSPLPGLVTEVLVQPFQRVEAGTPVARILSPALGELQMQLLQTAARATLAARSAAREQQLFNEGIVAERRLQEAQAEMAQAKAALLQARAALHLGGMTAAAIEELVTSGQAQQSITLSAAKAGVVTEMLIEAGQRVEPATALVHVADTRVLWLDIQVAVADLAAFPPGSTLAVVDRAARGQVRGSSPLVAADSQLATLRAELQDGADHLRPGEVVAVDLATGEAKDGWNLPLSAVVHDGDQAYVFVRTADGFEGRAVTVIDSAGGRARVAGALSAGDEVATRGVVALKGAWLEAKESK